MSFLPKLETSALKYHHELNSQNLQNHRATDFKISGFFSLTAATLESVLCVTENTNISGKTSGFGVFFSKWACLEVPLVSEEWSKPKIKWMTEYRGTT